MPLLSIAQLEQALIAWAESGALPPKSGYEHVVRDNPYSVRMNRFSPKRAGGGLVQVESMLEYDVAGLLEFDARIMAYKEQAVVIPWRDDRSRWRRYTPDFLARSVFAPGGRNMNTVVIEVKPYDVVVRDWPKLRAKARAVQEILRRMNIPFKLITDRSYTPVFMKNVNFLLNYDSVRMSDRGVISDVSSRRYALIREVLKEQPITTPNRVLDAITFDKTERNYLIPFLWHRLRYQFTESDLLEPLTMNSEIWDSMTVRRRPKWREPQHDWLR
jgi:hypothetical protein